MKNSKTERFDYLMNEIINDTEIKMELSEEELEFFSDVDLTEVLFI
jgi:hypothetical protein